MGKQQNMAGNTRLTKAKAEKQDEFYTQLRDIENELQHYKEFFKGKVVFCNCDDPYESNFFKYFAMNFNYLGLKKLICTSYIGSPIVGEEFSDLPLFRSLNFKKAYKVEITEVYDENGDGAVDMTDVDLLLKNMKNKMELLKGDGDFRSQECIELLKEADVIVTNPPFSLFRDFVDLLMKYDKRFLILGNMTSITHKNIFPYIKNNKIWTGYKKFGGGMDMIMPKNIFDEDKVKKYYINENNEVIVNIMGVIWYTNIDIPKRHKDLIPYKRYTPEEFPKYDNYDAINVNKISEIPEDYYGIIGVPITFLSVHNPDQFELVGCSYNYGRPLEWPENTRMTPTINGKNIFKRLFIKRKDQNEN